MTLREMTYDLKMKLKRNVLSDDSRLTNRLLQFWIASKRYDYIKKRENKKYKHNNQIVQNLSPLETQIIDVSLDPVNLPVGYSIIRTKEKIPQTIYFNEMDDGIQSVGSLDQLQRHFEYINYDIAPISGNSKYNQKEIFAFRLNDYIYLFSRDQSVKMISWLNVRGIFSNPMDLRDYKDQNGNRIFSIDHQYPIDEDMWEYIKNELTQSNIETLTQMPTDTSNDASDKYDYQTQNQ
jgi:hypothetical protein